MIRIFGSGAHLLLFCVIIAHSLQSGAGESYDWRQDWALDENFDIGIDTEGYRFPSSIAFVPEPGDGPKDPLYFVTELGGKVKVVTNDRTVYTFAEDFFVLKPLEELPAFGGEMGLAGICLDPAHGYVFVTFTYQDRSKILRNNIVRFKSEPGAFSVKPVSSVAFTEVFEKDASAPSHQIGPCQIYDDQLYVSLGDGFDFGHSSSQDINSLLGKVIRMTLDGKPIRDNPYYVDNDITKARNFVWASGFRNPFGLKIVDGRVFVADNGREVDRFLEVRRGEDYMWDGSDWSISTNAAVVFVPATGVAQLDYNAGTNHIFPDKFSGKFYLALCGDPDTDPLVDTGRGVVTLDYDFKTNKMSSPPSYFLRYRGSGFQVIAGLAMGPDGLYIVPILPMGDGRSAVLKVRYAEGEKHIYTIGGEDDPEALLYMRGCYGCHTRGENGWGTAGPKLDRAPMVARIGERINSAEYVEQVREIDRLDMEPYASYRGVRKEVLETGGTDRVRVWVKYHILEPKFDNPYSMMPNMGLTEKEAQLIMDYLIGGDLSVGDEMRQGVSEVLSRYIPVLRYRHVVYSFILGLSLSLLIVLAYAGFRKKR